MIVTLARFQRVASICESNEYILSLAVGGPPRLCSQTLIGREARESYRFICLISIYLKLRDFVTNINMLSYLTAAAISRSKGEEKGSIYTSLFYISL